jgi:hypothetical protein
VEAANGVGACHECDHGVLIQALQQQGAAQQQQQQNNSLRWQAFGTTKAGSRSHFCTDTQMHNLSCQMSGNDKQQAL